MSYECCERCLAHKSYCEVCSTKGFPGRAPTRDELNMILEELFDRSEEYNAQLQKQLAHVRSRVVQLIEGNKQMNRKLDEIIDDFNEYHTCGDEQNDM
jgi:hypothetical protein